MSAVGSAPRDCPGRTSSWPRWPPASWAVRSGWSSPGGTCSRWSATGRRPVQRVRLGADVDGGLRSIDHDAVVQTSRHVEFVEQVVTATRMMYAADNRRTRHRVQALDVPIPSWLRAPGECPGMFALESAMDELAVEVGIDPIELRIRNEPGRRSGAGNRLQQQGSRRLPAARCRAVRLVAARSATGRAAAGPVADRLRGGVIGVSRICLAGHRIGNRPSRRNLRRLDQRDRHRHRRPDGDAGAGRRGARGRSGPGGDPYRGFGPAEGRGGRWVVRHHVMGLGGAQGVPGAGRGARRPRWPGALTEDLTLTASTAADLKAREELSRYAFGAQFVQARVNIDTGEVRVPRMVGVFAAGRIVNPTTARSQLIGGMTMGLSMALHEDGVMDQAFGGYANSDLAGYHIASCADVGAIDVEWLDEHDTRINPLGTKGIGEIGIVGTAAAVANAVYNATGVRVRSLPRTARSQLIGGMTMGLSMALHEDGVMDQVFGGYANSDLASYHIASCADVGAIDVEWLDERDSRINPLGTKGIGEIGIVGTAAAVANAVYNATGIRVRSLPITVEDMLVH